MTDEERIEEVSSAWRPEAIGGGVRPHPAWADLDADGRRAAFSATVAQRALEAALDPEGLSTTARRVLDRIRNR
jgi:hypothetical protein